MGRWLAMAALAAAIVGGQAAAAAGKCQLRPLGELRVADKGGSMVVDGAINGELAKFVVDSGSPATMLFQPALDKLKLASRRMPNVTFYGVGGPEDAYTTWVKELRVADLTLPNATLFVSRGSIDGAAGLLGALFLFQADAEFDLARGAIRFFKAVNCVGDQVVYWGSAYSAAPLINAASDSPAVVVRLNGAPIQAIMDTGANISTITPDAATRFAKVTGGAPRGYLTGLAPNSQTPLSVATFDTFSFGDETIGHARLGIADMYSKDTYEELGSRLPRAAMMGSQMLLGADFFRSHRVYFSRDQHKVYVSYQGGPVFAPAAGPKP